MPRSKRLSADLNDVEALQELAKKTGGKFYRANDVSELQTRFQEVAEVVMKEVVKLKDSDDLYEHEFKSARSVNDGTARKITIVVKSFKKGKDGQLTAEGESLSERKEGHGQVHGLVVPEQSPVLYLVLLGCVVGSLALPAGLRVLNGSGKGR